MKFLKRKKLKLKWILLLCISFALTLGCEKEPETLIQESSDLSLKKNKSDDSFELSGLVFDISSTPDGGIMAAVNEGETKSVKVIRNGKVNTVNTLESVTNIQGVEALDGGKSLAITGALDLAQGGALYSITQGYTEMVADLSEFEREYDPDAFEGPMWKNQACEATDGFQAGPQNNPFKLTALSRESVIVADAAANTVLYANTSGEIDWKAILTPPTDENGWRVRWNTEVDGEEIPCYVQPVPTSVAVGPDGYLFVGELTGALAGGPPIGLSRVWKLPADATNVICTEDGSTPCNVLIDGLTSVMDVEVGPDGLLYVVELDENSWFATFPGAERAGGTVSVYTRDGEFLEDIATGLVFPSAITFDKKGNLWVLENKFLIGENPTISKLDL